ncbi:MAG: L-aspartate oxidase, partial [Chloroflexi bacterium]|nr:L-aspartate oxidase [Chloroflexota bacterium]
SAPTFEVLRASMNERVGITRDADGLHTALSHFDEWAGTSSTDPSLALATLSARLITEAALQRTESRGSHIRLDYPHVDPAWQRSSLWQLARE